MKNRALLPLSLFSLIFVGGGCFNFVTEEAIERQIESDTGGSADVDVEDNTITYTDEETGGEISIGNNMSLPSDFPTDFPIYEGDLTIISSANVPQHGISLTFSSKDSPSEIATWYEDELMKDDWTKDRGYDLQGPIVQSYSKGEMDIVVTISEEDGVTTAMIVRSAE